MLFFVSNIILDVGLFNLFIILCLFKLFKLFSCLLKCESAAFMSVSLFSSFSTGCVSMFVGLIMVVILLLFFNMIIDYLLLFFVCFFCFLFGCVFFRNVFEARSSVVFASRSFFFFVNVFVYSVYVIMFGVMLSVLCIIFINVMYDFDIFM